MKPNVSALARQHGISRQTLATWQREGIDIANAQAVAERKLTMRGKPSAIPEPPPAPGAETIAEARRRREVATADRAEIIAKREAGAVIAVSDVEAMMAALGAGLRSRLLSMRSDLVVELEGLSGSAIYKALDRRITELLASVHMKSLNPKP